MKAKALRLYGKEDLRLDEYELPEIKDDEILARVVSDSICMSSYKAAMQGEEMCIRDRSGDPCGRLQRYAFVLYLPYDEEMCIRDRCWRP